MTARALDAAFTALADGNRRAILGLVKGGGMPVGTIAAELGLSQQNTSHHLRVLRDAGLVTDVRAGTRHLYAVRVDGLAVGKAFFDDFWPERLTRLKSAIEQGDG